mmetsp:Transcript_1772/g.5392  ORF Transcript_1772/g.5392 Transcript_1772/m.5392 type:complete len:229 (-) Transcript_1772:589-1275(-)
MCVYVPVKMLLVKSVRFSTPLLFLSPPTSSSSFLSYINFSKIFPTAFCTRSESDSLFSTFTKGRLISSFISSSFLPMFSRRLLMLSSTTSFLLFLLPSLFVNIPLTIRGSASFIGSSLTIIDGAAFEWVASSFGSSGSKLPRAKRSSNSSSFNFCLSARIAPASSPLFICARRFSSSSCSISIILGRSSLSLSFSSATLPVDRRWTNLTMFVSMEFWTVKIFTITGLV